MAVPAPGPVNSQNRAHRANFWLLTGRALVLKQSLTSRGKFPLYHKAYKHVLGKFFVLNGATIRTSYNDRICYCWQHDNLLTLNIRGVAHASNNRKSYFFYDVLIFAPSRMLQQSAHAKFRLYLNLKQNT